MTTNLLLFCLTSWLVCSLLSYFIIFQPQSKISYVSFSLRIGFTLSHQCRGHQTLAVSHGTPKLPQEGSESLVSLFQLRFPEKLTIEYNSKVFVLTAELQSLLIYREATASVPLVESRADYVLIDHYAVRRIFRMVGCGRLFRKHVEYACYNIEKFVGLKNYWP